MLKKANAINPNTLATISLFAQQLAPQTNLARSSGAVIYLRLKTLFPAGSAAILNPANFSGNAPGIDNALGSDVRSFSPVAQMALRDQAASLCGAANPTLQTAGSIYSTTNLLAGGETMPSDPDPKKSLALNLAFTMARNVWLDLYTVDSPEVQALATLYIKQLAQGVLDPEARKNLCIAAIAAPQFWLGNATAGDALRRTALEIGRVVPSMVDLQAYANGSLSLRDYVKKLQTDPAYQPGYLSAVNDWHLDWLGLAPILPNLLQGDPNYENGLFGAQGSLYSWLGKYWTYIESVNDFPMTHGVAVGQKLPNLSTAGQTPTSWIVPSLDRCGDSPCASNSQPYNVANSAQPFDPRTTVLIWQHQNPSAANAWQTVGAWVQNTPAAIQQYLTATGQSALPAYCILTDTMTATNASDPYYVRQKITLASSPTQFADRFAQDNPAGWYKCDGMITNTNGTPFQTYLDDLSYATTSSDTAFAGKLVYTSAHLVGTPIFEFTAAQRRLRRFSPTGEQDGFSLAKLWYTSEEVYVSNTLDRYYAACFYRPPAPLAGHWGARGADWAGASWNAAIAWPASGYGQPPDTLAHPTILNHYFRCGKPLYSELVKGDAADENIAYPSGSTVFGPNVNDMASLAALGTNIWWPSADQHGPEWSATERLSKDLIQEPTNLIDYIITNNRSYQELLTANYTIGREELELSYRTSGLHMPLYPEGYQPAPAPQPLTFITTPDNLSGYTWTTTSCSPTHPCSSGANARLDYRLIDNSIITDLPAGLIKASAPQGNGLVLGWGTTTAAATLDSLYLAAPPKVAATDMIEPTPFSGILTMLQFRVPVASPVAIGGLSKMRTLSDRYFVRLMCGQPNLFVPDSEQEALQEPFVPISNTEVANHLDKTKGCYACHINMDPLAEALSPNFAQYVQNNEYAASEGEMASASSFQWGRKKGMGAVLGQKASGVRQVGQIIAGSQQFASCVVQTAFQDVFGRQMTFNDVQFVQTQTNAFMQGYNYNQLIQNLVDSDPYKRRD